MAALRVHQDRVEGQRSALPFEPWALWPAGEVERVRALQHQPLDAALAGTIAQLAQFRPIRKRHQRRQVETRRQLTGIPPLEPLPALDKRKGAQILLARAQDVVEPHCRRVVAQQLGGWRLAVEPLLQIVERSHLAAA